METKQVIVIRKDLKMRRGKEIAQGSHASMKVFFDLFSYKGINEDSKPPHKYELNVNDIMKQWMDGIFTKIVVYVNSLEEINELAEKAKTLDTPFAIITDCGKTEFGGVPTITAMAIGPDDVDIINSITGHLPLY